ncbi:MAG: PorT family protein [Saprospiraceae bacterium]|nr:PorT family protein [Saprospiraceae bacterium]
MSELAKELTTEAKHSRSAFLYFALFALLTFTANAQKIQVYQEVASNYTNIRATEPFPYLIADRDDIGNQASIGFETGFTVKFSTKNERLSFPFAVHFQRKGFHVKPDGPVFVYGPNGLVLFQTDRVGYRFDYLTFTPQAEYLLVGRWLGLSLGPYLSFRMKEGVKIYDRTGWEDDDGDSFVNKTDYGLQIGVQAYWKRFGLFARYQQGIGENDKFQTVDENFNPTGILSFRNQAAVLGLSFRLTNH